MSALWNCAACKAANPPRVLICEHCGYERGTPVTPETETAGANTCARCGARSPSTNEFHDDGAPEDRKVRLCPSCWIPALKRRAAFDPISAADRQRLRTQLFAALDAMDARNARLKSPRRPEGERG